MAIAMNTDELLSYDISEEERWGQMESEDKDTKNSVTDCY